MLRILTAIAMVLSAASAFAGGDAPDPREGIRIYKAHDDYDWVKQSLEIAITGRGLLISGTLHISDMLARTGKDLGFGEPIYVKAESIEFCSAEMSHRMAMVHPANLSVCPFTIALYIPADDPQQVYVAFRVPSLRGDASVIESAIFGLLDGIAHEAIQ